MSTSLFHDWLTGSTKPLPGCHANSFNYSVVGHFTGWRYPAAHPRGRPHRRVLEGDVTSCARISWKTFVVDAEVPSRSISLMPFIVMFCPSVIFSLERKRE